MVIEVYNSVQGAAFFQRLLQEWKKGGAQIRTYQAISEADYRARRGVIGRLVLRWRMYVAYAWVCWRGAERNPSEKVLRVATTNPFFAPALVRWTAGPRARTVNLLYDLFPEALIQAGSIKSNSLVARYCARITRFAIRESAATVFLGERLRAYAESTYGVARRALVIPVGADGIPFRDFPPMRLMDGVAPQILYSGQMGSMHEVDTLLNAWPEFSANVRWEFYAGGSGYRRLRHSVGRCANVVWGEALPEIKWQQAMKRAQVALVTIAPGAEKVVMPSKTYSALVAGQAILAICRRSSDLADLVLRHDCGWVVEPGDVSGLHQALSIIANSGVELWAKRRNSFEAGHRYYDMAPVAAEWAKLFAELEGNPPVLGKSRTDNRAA